MVALKPTMGHYLKREYELIINTNIEYCLSINKFIR